MRRFLLPGALVLLLTAAARRPKIPLPEDEATITVRRAAGILGIGESTAYRRAAAGEIPVLRVGGRVLVPTAALRRMVGLDQGEEVGSS